MKQTTIAKTTALLFFICFVRPLYPHFFSDFYDNYLKKWAEETTQCNYELEGADTVILEIPCGNILVCGWEGKNIVMTARKQVPSKEHLASITIKKTKESSKIMKISAQYLQPVTKGIIDIELLIPKNVHVSLANNQGSIKAKNLNGTVMITAQQGTIKTKEMSGNLIAHTESGDITIKRPMAHVKASTHTGNIAVYDAQRNITASTHSGSIDVRFKKLDTQATVHLSSTSGQITLGLPEESNADLYARTEKGQLVCDHFITTKPQTIQLNHKTWQRLKREINGFIGSGEASIKLTSVNSSIKIMNTTSHEKTATA